MGLQKFLLLSIVLLLLPSVFSATNDFGCCCTGNEFDPDIYSIGQTECEAVYFGTYYTGYDRAQCQQSCGLELGEQPAESFLQTCEAQGGFYCTAQNAGSTNTIKFTDEATGRVCYVDDCQSGSTQTPQCTGQPILNAVACSGSTDGLTQSYSRELVASCNSQNKCEYVCDVGYEPEDGVCISPIEQCNNCDIIFTGDVTTQNPLIQEEIDNEYIQVIMTGSAGTFSAKVKGDGTYTVGPMPPGSYTIYAAPRAYYANQGFYSSDFTQTISINPTQASEYLVIDRAVGYTVTGTVIDENDQGLVDATVFVQNRQISTTSDNNGKFTIENVLGSLILFATKEGYIDSIPKTYTVGEDTNIKYIKLHSACSDPATAKSITASHIRGSSAVKLNWVIENDCSADYTYAVQRCEGNGCFTLTQTLGEVTDESTTWAKTYEYRVLVSSLGTDTQSETSITTGDAFCEGKNSALDFCENNIGYSCSPENEIVEKSVCSDSQSCVLQSVAGSTEIISACITPSNACGRGESNYDPFGLKVTSDICYERDNCYYDVGKTSVNSCLSVKPYHSCGVFQSEDACTFEGSSLNEGCVWKDIDTGLGTGVCVFEAEPECGQCDDDGLCSQLECSAIGDACYFSGSGATASCYNVADVTCYQLSDQQSCKDATDDPNGPLSCQWNGKCIRESDENQIDDCLLSELDTDILNPLEGSVTQRCKLDRIAPITYSDIPLEFNPLIEPVVFNFLAIDPETEIRLIEKQTKGTYVCFGKDECAQNLDFSKIDGTIEIESMFVDLSKDYSLKPGENTIYFYSIDQHNNKEQTQSQTFTIQQSIPTFGVVTSISENADFTSDVSIFVTSSPAQCFIYDVNEPETIPEKASVSALKTSHSEKVLEGAPDGTYGIVVACVDALGNVNKTEPALSIDLNADSRATSVMPNGLINKSTFTMEFTTADDLICRYSQNPADEFEDMNPNNVFETEDQVESIRQFKEFELASGQYLFNIICDANNQDIQMFNTLIIDTSKPSASHSLNSNLVSLECIDSPNFGYGCDVVYCETDALTCDPDTPYDTQLVANQNICYAAKEKITGQLSQIQCTNEVIDRLPPHIILDQETYYVSNTPFTISGQIYDLKFERDSVDFTQRDSQFMWDAQVYEQNLKDIFLQADITISADNSDNPSLSLFFKDLELRFDASSVLNRKIELYQDGTLIRTKSLDFIDTPLDVRIYEDRVQVNNDVFQFSSSASGDIYFVGQSETNHYTVSNLKLADLSSQVNTVAIKRGQQILKQETTDTEFSLSIQLPDIVDDMQVTLDVIGQDRENNFDSKSVTAIGRVLSPKIINLTLSKNRQVIIGEQIDVQIEYEDILDVSQVELQIGDETIYISESDSLDTSQLSLGLYNITVKIGQHEKEFVNAIELIYGPLEWMSQINPIYTRSLQPQVSFVADRPVQCFFELNDARVQFTNIDSKYSVTVPLNANLKVNEPNYPVIDCGVDGKTSTTIHVDQKSPVVGVIIENDGVLLLPNYNRVKKLYQTTADSLTLTLLSDENVTCQDDIQFEYRDTYEVENLLEGLNTFTFVCQDRAQNLAVTRTIIIERTIVPFIFNIGPRNVNTEEATIEFYSSNDVSCTIEQGGNSITAQSDTNHKRSAELTFDKAENQLVINCGSASRFITIKKDTVEPTIRNLNYDSVTSQIKTTLTGEVSEPVQIDIYNPFHIYSGSIISQFTIDVPVTQGTNSYTIVATDAANNKDEQIVTISGTTQNNIVLDQVPLVFENERVRINGVTQGSSGITVSNGFVDFSGIPIGKNVVALTGPSGYASLVLTKDPFVPSIDTQIEKTQANVRITGGIGYKNVLLNTFVNGLPAVRPINEVAEFIGDGKYLVEVASTNELYRTARTVYLFEKNLNPPYVTDIQVEGTQNEITSNARPKITVTLSEPGRIVSANVQNGRLKTLPNFMSQTHTLEFASDLQEGKNKITVVVGDDSQNSEAYSQDFTYEIGAFNFTLTKPTFGITYAQNPLLEIKSNRQATCEVRSVQGSQDAVIMESSGVTHTTNKIAFGSQINKTIFVTCTDIVDNNLTKEFTLELDRTPPVIQVKANHVTNGKIVGYFATTRLNVTSDDGVICKYGSLNNTPYASMTFFNSSTELLQNPLSNPISIADNRSYDFFVMCENGAGNFSDRKKVSFSVDYDKSPTLKFLKPLPYVNVSKVTVQVQSPLAVNLDSCTLAVNGNDSQKFDTLSGRVLEAEIELEQGKNKLFASCDYLTSTGSQNYIVYYDNTPPVFEDAKFESEVSPGSYFKVEVTYDEPESRIVLYEFALGTAKYPATGFDSEYNRTTTRDDARFRVNDLSDDNETYYWSFRAKNGVELWSKWNSTNGTTISEERFFTGVGEDQCQNNIEDGLESDVDCGGDTCAACNAGKACFDGADCRSGSCSLSSNICLEATCDDGIKNSLESDVDCGGTCSTKCELASSCILNSDCNSQVCAKNSLGVGVCANPTCSDGMKNGDETQIDCGGSCGACEVGSGCSGDSDCSSGEACVSRACMDKSLDTDGDGIPDYWEEYYDLDPNDPDDAQLDYDEDGLTNFEEYDLYRSKDSTDPNLIDTDGDGASDGAEIKAGTDPLDPNDKPGGIWGILFIIFLLLILIAGGVVAYLYFGKKDEPHEEEPQTQSMMRPTATSASVQHTSVRDQLKNALQRKLKHERKNGDKDDETFDSFGAPKEPDTRIKSTQTAVEKLKALKKTPTKSSALDKVKQISKHTQGMQKIKEGNTPKTGLDKLKKLK